MAKTIVRRLDWDSDFFSMNIGEILISGDGQVSEDLSAFDVLYVKSDRENEFQIPGFASGYLEQKIVFGKELTDVHAVDSAIISTKNFPVTAAQLYELAYESGKFSRFKQDAEFGDSGFRRLYRLWVDNSLNGTFADEVLIHSSDNRITGLVTVRFFDHYGLIGLIAVSPQSQGQGIGRKLIFAVESILKSRGITELRIPTQGINRTACAFYEKLGYTVIQSEFLRHYRATNDDRVLTRPAFK